MGPADQCLRRRFLRRCRGVTRFVMRVLVVTAMYPQPDAPHRGVFVYDQVESLRRLGAEVDVLDLGSRRGLLKYVLGGWRVFITTLLRRYDVVHGHYGFAGLV